MDKESLQEFSEQILNQSGLTKILQEKIPQLGKLERLEGLNFLRLTEMKTGDILILSYTGVASKSLYPAINKQLVEKDIIKLSNLLNSEITHEGHPDEYQKIHLGFSENSIQVFLRVYNPNYEL